MKKNELMEMAREFCVSATPGRKNFYDADLIKFANAILERAAVEFDNRGKYKDGSWSTGSYDPDAPGIILREMKLPTN